MPPRMTAGLIAVLAVALAGFAPVPPAKAKKPAFSLADLEGTWDVEKHQSSVGSNWHTVYIQRGTWMAKFVFRDGKDIRSTTSTLKLDASRSPAKLDFVVGRGENDSYRHLGVVELKGDRLTVVRTTVAAEGEKERPKALDGQLGDREERFVLKRRKK